MHERSIGRGGGVLWEEASHRGPRAPGSTSTLGREGPWQHDTRGQVGPAACSPQPEALTPHRQVVGQKVGPGRVRHGRTGRDHPPHLGSA